MQLEFRKAVKEDVPKLIAFLKETIVEVYGQILSWEVLQPWVEGDRLNSDVNQLLPNMILAEEAGEVLAVAANLDDMVAFLWVHPAHHRKGIGSVLLDIVETEIRKSGYETAKLECFSDNDKAMGFYLTKGWKLLCEEMDEEAGALKMVLEKPLIKKS
ncbi:MAG: GNAT family N-acetyltransferase [Methanothrix sp.]|nr:GNAT family N-acetyltransferase [Methanothrix sp.]MDD4448836.1 GNAT family N-acetyltransferase [Methanothrix sp.]